MMVTAPGPIVVTLSDSIIWLISLIVAVTNAPTIVMAGLMSSAGCQAGSAPLPASIPTPIHGTAKSSPTTPHVPMFHQDARDVMMSAPEEMVTRISWTTEWNIQEDKQHLPEDLTKKHLQGGHRGHPPPTTRCVTISASQMEAAMSHTSDHQDRVNIREAAFLMTLAEAALEHQMNVIIATKCSLVLQKKRRNQPLTPDIQETKEPGTVTTNVTQMGPKAIEAAL